MTPSKNQVTVVWASPGKIVACAVERPRDIRHNTVGSDGDGHSGLAFSRPGMMTVWPTRVFGTLARGGFA